MKNYFSTETPLSSSPPSRRDFLRSAAVGAAALTLWPLGLRGRDSAADGKPDFATREVFDRIDLSINGGDGYKHDNPETSLLFWGQSYIMEAYNVMYEAYRDSYYIEKVIDHIDHVLAIRDSERGVTDYRGLSTPAWRISDRGLAPFIPFVGTAMLVYPMVHAARIIRETPELNANPKYRAKVDQYIEAAEKAVAVHEFQWKILEDGNGWYVRPKGFPRDYDGIEKQFNMVLRMGMVHLQLAALTGKAEHLDRALQIGRRWKEDLWVDQNDGLLWHYHWTGSRAFRGWTVQDGVSENSPDFSGNQRMEDISHGHVSLGFAELAFRHGLLFDKEDMQRFANTFNRNATVQNADGQPTMSWFIDGSGEAGGARVEMSAGPWARLAPFNQQVFHTVREIHNRFGFPRSRAHLMLVGSAYLNRAAQNASPIPESAKL